jgi:Nuclease-related domain
MYRWQWIPLAWLAASFAATVAVLVLWRRRGRSSDEERHPLQRDLLRGPGESQRDRIAAEAWNAAEYAALCVFLPPLMFCVYPLKSVYDGELPEQATLAAFSLAAAALLAWPLARLWRVLAHARSLALGYEAEVAAGQELDALRHLDYCVFHDVPAEGLDSNIDHVVVGPAGVFAVSAVGRMASDANEGGEPTEVTYDGERLQFPGWEETLPLGQVVAHADWLCGWLANALNEPVAVRAILVLPGWSVKRTAVSGIPVLAARRVNAYFSRMRPLPEMTDTMVDRIAEQLDRHCRVVALVPPVPPAAPREEPPPQPHQREPQERAAVH